MGWFAIAFVCFCAILIFTLNAYKNKRGRKDAHGTSVTTKGVPSEPTELPALKNTPDKYKQNMRKRASRETTTYVRGGKVAKTYARYDWQKIFEDSIRTPFTDESSPALPYLHKVYELEMGGADQKEVQIMLDKARKLDAKTTLEYQIRWDIIKKRQNQN